MADTQKKYVDQAGLQKAFSLIASKYSTIADYEALVALIGAAAKGDAEAKNVLERIAALEALAGNESVADQIETAVSAEAEIARAAEEAAQKAADDAQADVDALDALVGFTAGEGADDPKTVKAYIDAEVAKAKGDASKVAEDLASEVERAEGAEEALAGRLDVIEGEGEGSIAKAQADAVAEAEGYTDTQIGAWSAAGETPVAGTGLRKEIEDKIAAVNGDAAALAERVTTAEGKLDVIQGEDEGSIKKALADAKAYTDASEARLLGSDELAESLDSIKDIVDYITASDDKEGVTNLFEMVTANGQAIADEAQARQDQIGTIPATVGETATTTVVAYVDAKVAALNTSLVALTDEEITAAFNA